MHYGNDPIGPEDYKEPTCLLNCAPGRDIQSVPQRRIQEKLDEYMDQRDYAGAERHLLYWQEEARQGHDLQGQLLICNELIGFYRKTDRRDQSYAAGDDALRLLRMLSLEDSVSAGTTCVNLATACSAFGEDERALSLFRRARSIYERRTDVPPDLLGGLYNNMGLSCAALGRFAEACSLYALAQEKMLQVPGSEPERAITCLNMADALDAEQGNTTVNSERISEQLRQARRLLLESETEHNGYFAFVCEKCAPGFRYYGDLETADELERLSGAADERS